WVWTAGRVSMAGGYPPVATRRRVMAVFRTMRQLLTLAAVAALAGCGQPPNQQPGQPRVGEPEALTLTGVSRLPAGADAPVDAAVAGLGRSPTSSARPPSSVAGTRCSPR